MVSLGKRKHTETAGGGSGAAKNGLQKFKKQRTHTQKGFPKNYAPNEQKGDSTGALRSRIRNLKRLLSHIDNDADNKMPANIRIERERELETCEHELVEKQQQQRETEFRNKIIGKYHHIRFFERQKATRSIKRLQKQLAALSKTNNEADEPEKIRLRQALHNADVDPNYTIYYPLLKSYVSLFPNPKKDQNDNAVEEKPASASDDGPKGNTEMWKAVEQAMEDGTLEALRHSRDGVTLPGPKESISQQAKAKKSKREEKQKQKQATSTTRGAHATSNTGGGGEEDDDEDSDGGFFE